MDWSRVYNHVEKMMQQRGYDKEVQRVESTSNDKYMFLFRKGDHITFVYFHHSPKMNIDAVKEFIYWIETNEWRHSILVYDNIITSTTKKVIESLDNHHIELFDAKEFLYDMTQLRYYCPHERVDRETAQSIIKKYGNKLPKLLKSDPVCRYFGFQKGDIIRVHRRNGTIAFRIILK